MEVKFVDLKRQNKEIEQEIFSAISKTIEKCDFILGENVNLFEKDFATFCNSKYSVGVSSGTDAIHLCLRALGIGEGDSVIVPVNTFIATALGVIYTGARVIFVDCLEKDFNLDISLVDKILKQKKDKLNIRAIIPVHLYGQCCDMEELISIANKYEVKIIEDACQAHGAKYKNKLAGSFGICAAFSFYPGKNLGCFGDGGAIVTNDKEVYEKILMLRNYGQKEKYKHLIVGFNSRLDTIQAAVLKVKLKYLKNWNDQRRQAANLYLEKLKNKDIILPYVNENSEHIWHLFVVRVKKRDELIKYLKMFGIETGIHYPVPLHLHPAFNFIGYKNGDFPVAEKLSNEILSLPMFPGITEEEIKYVVSKIEEFLWKN